MWQNIASGTGSADPRPIFSSLCSTNHIHKFCNLAALIFLVARRDRVLDTVPDVVAQNLLLKPAEGHARSRNLRHDVNAVAILVEHFRQAAHLAFNAAQALLAPVLDVLSHGLHIPLAGIFDKSTRRRK